MKRQSVGVVMNYVKDDRIFNNGLFQNIYTLCDMLQKEGTYDTFLYVGVLPADVDPKTAMITFSGLNIKVLVLKDVVDGKLPTPDLFIEAGSPVPNAWLEKLYKINPRLKVVPLKYGNDVLGHVENAIRMPGTEGVGKKRDSTLLDKTKRDIIWASAHFAEFEQFYKWRYDAKIFRVAPFVWSSQYLDHVIKSDNVEISNEFGRVAIVEPNISIVKTAIAPVAIIDAASQKSDAMKKGVTFCTEQWCDDPYHIKWVKDLHVYRNNKLTFNARYRFAHIFAKSANAGLKVFDCGTLLSHHFHNGLNYVYLEALYLGIPLVHNSEFMKDAGYYYDGWNVIDGADALIRAIETGREGLTPEYKEIAKQTLWRHSPENPENIRGYIDLIKEALDS